MSESFQTEGENDIKYLSELDIDEQSLDRLGIEREEYTDLCDLLRQENPDMLVIGPDEIPPIGETLAEIRHRVAQAHIAGLDETIQNFEQEVHQGIPIPNTFRKFIRNLNFNADCEQ